MAIKLPTPGAVLRQVVDGARAIARDLTPATEAERERRIAICMQCPLVIRDERPRCGVCQCPIERKAAFLSQACPDNPPRW